jgi:GTPase SAR1 family protein
LTLCVPLSGNAATADNRQDAWGQERYRTTTYAYFRGGGTFVLVYNVENAQSLANIRDAWGPQVRCHSHPQAPVIIGTRLLRPSETVF